MLCSTLQLFPSLLCILKNLLYIILGLNYNAIKSSSIAIIILVPGTTTESLLPENR